MRPFQNESPQLPFLKVPNFQKGDVKRESTGLR